MSFFKTKSDIRNWWISASASTFGTVLGIILTVGVTYWQQQENQKEMTRKIAKITFHNIDVRINNLELLYQFLAEKDTTYSKLISYTSEGINKLSNDSALLFLNALYFDEYYGHDTKSEEIFSSSFEVWQYLDDEKVIGRISNCYSTLEHIENQLRSLKNQLKEVHFNLLMKLNEEKVESPIKMLQFFLSDPKANITYESLKYIYMYKQLFTPIKALNDTNKKVLNISQEELDELSNLLDDTAQIQRQTIRKILSLRIWIKSDLSESCSPKSCSSFNIVR